ncbi:MAG TPA: dihydropteroate synthase [Nocardioides sp.]|nr:dihydropteroate synthase [Nocardioides sp.]
MVLSLADLAALHATYAQEASLPVRPARLGDVLVGDDGPVLMGVVNLSRDSTYRDSVAVSTAAAIRKARVQIAQGAHVIDVGAESSLTGTERIDPDEQIARLVPVITEIAVETVVSVETYDPSVVEACLKSGAQVLNMTGREHETEMLELAAEHEAAVVLCFGEAANVRESSDLDLESDPIPALVDHFGERLEIARRLGVDDVVVDPAIGFSYSNLTDPLTRARHQTRMLAHSFRLRTLGVPVCNALPHAFDLFEDEFRKAEGFFAVLASLGGTHLFRTHETAHVRAVLASMAALTVD